jgi:hypothetical protein
MRAEIYLFLSWTGHEGSRSLRLPVFPDKSEDLGEKGVSPITGHLYPHEISPVLMSVNRQRYPNTYTYDQLPIKYYINLTKWPYSVMVIPAYRHISVHRSVLGTSETHSHLPRTSSALLR